MPGYPVTAWCAASAWWKPGEAIERVFTGASATAAVAGAGSVIAAQPLVAAPEAARPPAARTRTVRTAFVRPSRHHGRGAVRPEV